MPKVIIAFWVSFGDLVKTNYALDFWELHRSKSCTSPFMFKIHKGNDALQKATKRLPECWNTIHISCKSPAEWFHLSDSKNMYADGYIVWLEGKLKDS